VAWMTSIGVAGKKNTFTRAIAEKVNKLIPGTYVHATITE